MADTAGTVHEMQGLYGPFTIAERVVQKIWLRRDFALRGLTLWDGRPLEIQFPGRWNLLGGPDFFGARLVIDGRILTGDVEVHFQAGDWRGHGHDTDPAYDGVILHVLMFPPSGTRAVARKRTGESLPTLVLLPLLHRSLEEHASDEALENLTARDTVEKMAGLSLLAPADRRSELRGRAQGRWEQKVKFAGLRIGKLGWRQAAHQTALEILGYRHNRAAMLAVAARYPLEEWGGGLDGIAVYRANEAMWQLPGTRPANHPLRRLRQYAAWVEQVPDWPDQLKRVVESGAGETKPIYPDDYSARKLIGLPALRHKLIAEVTGGAIRGSRFDNLVCDGFLPLITAAGGRNMFPQWFHWYLGDVPAEVRRALGTLGLSGPGAWPQSHGWAQALLAWIIEQDARASD